MKGHKGIIWYILVHSHHMLWSCSSLLKGTCKFVTENIYCTQHVNRFIALTHIVNSPILWLIFLQKAPSIYSGYWLIYYIYVCKKPLKVSLDVLMLKMFSIQLFFIYFIPQTTKSILKILEGEHISNGCLV